MKCSQSAEVELTLIYVEMCLFFLILGHLPSVPSWWFPVEEPLHLCCGCKLNISLLSQSLLYFCLLCWIFVVVSIAVHPVYPAALHPEMAGDQIWREDNEKWPALQVWLHKLNVEIHFYESLQLGGFVEIKWQTIWITSMSSCFAWFMKILYTDIDVFIYFPWYSSRILTF